MAADITTLMDQAKCIGTCIPPGMQLAVIISLLDQIVTNGNTAPDYINYAGPPTSNPPALAHIVVDSNGQQWQFYQNAWH